MSLKIGIEATAAFKQSAGVGRYARGLILGLKSLSLSHSLKLVCSSDSAIQPWAEGFSTIKYPFSERAAAWLWQRFQVPLPIETFTGKIDVFHGPNFTLPALRGARGVTTIHDLSFLSGSPWHPPSLKRYLEKAVRNSLARSHAILADSESTKVDILNTFSYPEEKVAVVYPGVENLFRVQPSPVSKYPLPATFLLAVGTLEPRKNLETLLDALKRLRREDTHLVLAGGGGWLDEKNKLLTKISRLGLEKRVHLLGFVPDEDLVALYNLAQLVVYPSLYEGFGLPVLEAMACGAPVICSRLSSIPEAGGEAAVYLEDPKDADEMARKIETLLDVSAERSRYRALGLEHVKAFTWENAARRTLAVYEG